VFRHDDLFTDLNGPAAMTLLATGVTGFDSREETYSCEPVGLTMSMFRAIAAK